MLKKICLCIASAMLYSLLISGAAFAAPACDVIVDTDTETITVSGNTDIAKEAQLSLIILAEGVLGDNPYEKTSSELSSIANEKLDVLTDSTFSEVINSFRQISTDADGNFNTTFKMSAPDSGDYGVVLNYRNNDSDEFAFVVPFFYCTPEHAENAIDTVNLADSTAIGSKITDLYRELGLDLTAYNALDAKGQSSVVQYMYNVKEELKAENETGFLGAGDIKNAFSDALAYYELKNADDTELGALLTKHADLLKLSEMSEYATYTTTLSSAEQKEVLTVCAGFDGCVYIEDMKRLFGDKIILCAVKSAESWTEINSVLTANKESLADIDSEYWELEDTSDVDKEIVGKSFDSISELAEEMKSLIDEASDSDNDDSGKGSSGGRGSGGGGGGAAIVAPPITEAADKTENAQKEELPFADMSGYEWANEAVSELYKSGIVSGRDETSFAPGEFVTREEFVKMLVCLLGEYDKDAKADFADVNAKAWYYSYIGSAQLSGISNGLGDGRFGVGMLITRQDIAVMACRAAGVSVGEAGPEFTDEAEISEYAKDSVSALASCGIISGMGDGAFAPKVNATRAQAAKILFELHRWKEKTV